MMTNPHLRGSRGFTITETLVVIGLSTLTIAMIGFLMMGFRFAAKSTMEQVNTQFNNHQALEKMGRTIMQASRVDLVKIDGQTDPEKISLWQDFQVIWTPQTTADDTQGLIYLDPETKDLVYQRDVSNPDDLEILARKIEAVEFGLVGNALFVKLTMKYDQELQGSERTLFASFSVRNNPKFRVGASI